MKVVEAKYVYQNHSVRRTLVSYPHEKTARRERM